MNKNQTWVTIVLAVLIILLIGAICGLTYYAFFRRPPEPAQDPNQIYTEAAKTVESQVTLAAQQTALAKYTEVAGATATSALLPSPTFTLIVPTGIVPTQPPPTSPPVNIPTATPNPIPCDRATFIKDVTVPDNTVMNPGTPFTKVWRVRNDGSCAWDASYFLVFASGSAMTTTTAVAFPGVTQPGQSVDLSVNMVAPNSPGTFQGNWLFRNNRGQTFGVGTTGGNPIWVKIRVPLPITPNPNYAYDFAANYCSAQWQTGAGVIGCNTPSNDPRGSVTLLTNPPMENRTDDEPGLWVRPNQASNGFIAGQYPPYQIKPGDRFVSEINCAQNATNCNVIFQVDIRLSNGTIISLFQWNEVLDGKTKIVDLDLSGYNGQTVQFILRMFNNGNVNGANGIWFVPSIRRSPPTSTPPPPPTATLPPPTATAPPLPTLYPAPLRP
jgi:hypothetical protein